MSRKTEAAGASHSCREPGLLEETPPLRLLAGYVRPLGRCAGSFSPRLAAQPNARAPFLLFDVLHGESGVRSEELGELLVVNVDAELFE